jgi:hypothetical protein
LCLFGVKRSKFSIDKHFALERQTDISSQTKLTASAKSRGSDGLSHPASFAALVRKHPKMSPHSIRRIHSKP